MKALSKVSCLFTAITLMAIVLCSFAQADYVTKGLVAYWSLDAGTISGENVRDVIGDNDGIIVGNLVQVNGQLNGALEFDGESSVDVAGTEALNFNGMNQMTVAAWIKPASDSPVVGVVEGCCGTVVAQRDANSWALRYDGRNPGNEFEFITQPNWQGDAGFGAAKPAAGEWHYLTAIVNIDMKLFYLDGQLVMEEAYTGPMASNGPETDIGHASDGGFVGVIDEVAIYNRALSAAEVMQNYQTETAPVSLAGKLASTWGQLKNK